MTSRSNDRRTRTPSRRRRATTGDSSRAGLARTAEGAAVERLHLAAGDRTLRSLVTVDELDVLTGEAALRAWSDGPLEQYAQCVALLGPIRPSSPADLGAENGRTEHGEHAERAGPIPGQRA